ncbi:hypothetical protein [uncultured Arenimonas sp.]|uniref:hypothetical protein n=1 Tax=uncultured Arenimonas sp. TaxID=546226 RepID=UPI0030DB83D7
MNATVDVLAVMQRHVDAALAAYNTAARDAYSEDEIAEAVKLNEWLRGAATARAAVAELVEADREYDEAMEALKNTRNTGASTESWNRMVSAKNRRAAALAKFGVAT